MNLSTLLGKVWHSVAAIALEDWLQATVCAKNQLKTPFCAPLQNNIPNDTKGRPGAACRQRQFLSLPLRAGPRSNLHKLQRSNCRRTSSPRPSRCHSALTGASARPALHKPAITGSESQGCHHFARSVRTVVAKLGRSLSRTWGLGSNGTENRVKRRILMGCPRTPRTA